MKHLLRLNTLFLMVFIFLVMWLLSLIPIRLDFLDPIGNALADFETTDMVFSQFRDEKSIAGDTNIVIVNLSTLPRNEIAVLLDTINSYAPKAVGVDAFFRKPKSPELDGPLAAAFARTRSLVLVSKVAEYNEQRERFDSLETSHPMFQRYGTTGFANEYSTDETKFKTIRSFSPRERVGDTVENCFAAQLALICDSAAYARLMERENKLEVINYRGNKEKFFVLSPEDVLDPETDKSFLRDKIVLLGFMGKDINTPSLEDVFYTPMNPRFAGKTVPDMYGIVIHANVLSMILARNYTDVMPGWFSILLAFLLCYLSCALFYWMNEKLEEWYSAGSKIVILIETIVILALYVVIFNHLNYKIDLTLALIACALAPDMLEIYNGSVRNLLRKIRPLRHKLEE